MDISNRYKCDILALSEELSSGRITSKKLTQLAIEQHEINGSSLNAYKCWQPEKALEMADRADDAFAKGEPYKALQGIPVSVKDIYGLDGYPIFAGSASELPVKWQRSGPLVANFAVQHAVFMGKTHTVEFAYGGLGINNHWDTPRNPWDKENHRVPGGSSSGAGVSLWEGSALVALGTDTSGSVRVPASFTGNVGLKTSIGLWPTDGIVPLSPTLDTAGILTRTVADANLVHQVITMRNDHAFACAKANKNAVPGDQFEYRIGIDGGQMWSESTPEIAEICMNALRALNKDHRCQLLSFDFPEAKLAIEMRNVGGPVSVELIEFLQSELPEWYENLDPVIRERIKMGGDISAVEYLRRVRQITAARQSVKKHFGYIDIIASPTVPISPPMMSEISTPKDYMKRNLLALQNTTVGSFLDLCAVTVPVGLDSKGMPVGLQFMSTPKTEDYILELGQRLEKIVRKHQLMPY